MRVVLPIAVSCLSLLLFACSSSQQESVGSLVGTGDRPPSSEDAPIDDLQRAQAFASVAPDPLTLNSKRPSRPQPVGGIARSRLAYLLAAGDTPLAVDAELFALESGAPDIPYGWRNTANGHMGIVIAGPARHIGGRECRPVRHTLKFAKPPQSVRGTGCRMANGSWQIL